MQYSVLKDDYVKLAAIPQTIRSFPFEILKPQTCRFLSNNNVPERRISFFVTSKLITIGT